MTSASSEADGMFHDSALPETSEQSFISRWLSLKIGALRATFIYLIYALLVYWPVLLGKRFFWEDFFIQEYPIREYCYYLFGVKHLLPFWNPYSWEWSALLADAQSGFWYPANLLQILVTKVFLPGAIHLPVIVPELTTILHLPLAALGVYQVCRKRFHTSDLGAIVAGLCFGFGARLVAEQNHAMTLSQIALVPWGLLLLMQSWTSIRSAVALGLFFGISFFAGQPQVFFFSAVFFSCFTLAEVLSTKRDPSGLSFRPLFHFALAMLLAAGVAAIQLLPTFELSQVSARAHLSYSEAGSAAINFGHLLNFFVPKYFGENPGFTVPRSDTVVDMFWHWEAIFYWGILPEILAVFAATILWKLNRRDSAASRYLKFAVIFFFAAIAYGLGQHLHFQWLFWRFLPIFNQLRGPNRMICYGWLLGTIYTAVGIDLFFRSLPSISRYQKFFLVSSGLFVFLNTLANFGLFDLLFNETHVIRHGLFGLTLHSLLISALVFGFFAALKTRLLPLRYMVPIVLSLIIADLYYCDFTWHRNTLSRETVVAHDSTLPAIRQFASEYPLTHSRLLWSRAGYIRARTANLSMFLRLPIEDGHDSSGLKDLNPMRLSRVFPPVADSIARMKIMGVSSRFRNYGASESVPDALPYLKLYDKWIVARSDSAAAKIYTDSSFDFHRTIILDNTPEFDHGALATDDTALLTASNENGLTIEVHASKPSILLVNDLYYVAWKAQSDNHPVPIYRGFTALRAIPVAPGVHQIRLAYESDRFSLGWKITVASILLCFGLLFSPFTRKRVTAPSSPVAS